MSAGREANERRSRDRWIPWAFVAFFLVVVAANGVMVYLAQDTWTGVVTENHYEKGLAYNEALARARAQDALGWQVDVAFTPAEHSPPGDPRAHVVVTMRDRDGRPLADGEVRARFVRPTHEGFDAEVALTHLGNGRYGADVSLALPGQWDMVVSGFHDGATYQTARRVHLRP
jgi:nitrogen fixation protein FixH